MTLLDTHYHLDFLADSKLRVAFLTALPDHDVQVVAQTLTPSAFMELLSQAKTWAKHDVAIPPLSLGFHPWHIGTPTNAATELDLFADAIQHTRFIGEIGLDYSPSRLAAVPAVLQYQVFQQLLRIVCDAAQNSCDAKPYVLSIHAVRSAGIVLDILSDLDARTHNVIPVFHRFSGTSDDLTRLIRLGGYLSVQPQLLTSKRGRAYIQQIPAERLLLESDLPLDRISLQTGAPLEDTARQHAHDLIACLSQTIAELSQLRGSDMKNAIATTQSLLYEIE
ncbi:MAG: TatD family hydrolase [Propionibacteriaceae bacterium]